ncbi:MAG: DUF4258 domain-containing protein [Niastella sp.]|nr:DUF4258 domain-containing protein [Niastella sp.]
MKKTWIPIFSALITIGIALTIALNNKHSRKKQDKEQPRQEEVKTDPEQVEDTASQRRKRITHPPSDRPVRDIGFDRRHADGKLIFTKHARCRMACRHIDESEVKDILEHGVVNDGKSEPAARPDPKYALEGRTRDGQQVRIVFAPADRGTVVITVIDLDTDWSCDCK